MTPKNPRPKPTPTRIGKAPVGRILLMFIEQLMNSHLSAESMRATMRGVYTYLHVPELLLDINLDKDIFLSMLSEIDLSVARSEKARQRAALRKSTRQSPPSVPESAPESSSLLCSGSGASAPPLPSGAFPVAAPESAPESSSLLCSSAGASAPSLSSGAFPVAVPGSAPESSSLLCSGSGASAPSLPSDVPPSVEITTGSPPVRPVRKPARDPDEPAFTYRPPQEKPPKAYVIQDDEETEPYDPYGVRKAVEMQTRYGRLVWSNLW